MTEQKLREEKRGEHDEERKRKELEKKRKEKEEKKRIKKVSNVEITKLITQEIAEAIVEVPLLKLEEPKIEIKEVEILKEIPHIKKEELEVKVPILQLSSPAFGEKKVNLNKEVPSVESFVEKKVIRVPLVKLRKVCVKCIISEFNSNIPVIRPKPQTRIGIPIYRVLRAPAIREISLLDKKIDEKLLEKLERKIIQTPEPQVSVISKEAEPSLGGGEEIEEEPPEVIKFVFGGYSSRMTARGPIVVLYKELENDSTIGSFETVCIRIFRERKGGEPGYFSIKKLDDFNIREIEKYIKPEGNIVRIDLDILKEDVESKKENVFRIISPEYLRETLSRFIIGDVSFLIFKTRDEKLYHHCKQVLGKLSANIEHPLKVVEITPQEMTIDQKRILTGLAWGVPVKGIDADVKIIGGDRPIGTTLDDIFNKFGKIKHEEYLEYLKEERGGIYVQATNEHEGEESDLHLQIKWLIVKLLSRKYGFMSLLDIEDNIKTEEQLPEVNIKGEYPKPDVWDTKENVVYEVETLFSEDREGKTPQRKIYESIRKYEGTSIKKINIVLDNLTFLLHIKDLWRVKKNIKEWEQKTGKKVEFFTLDLENHRLLSLLNFSKRIKGLIT